MLGPFDQESVVLHISAFMTREKPNSEVRRTIVDLSWPKHFSVNAGVKRCVPGFELCFELPLW